MIARCAACASIPTNSNGPCSPTGAGPYVAWMPRKSLHGWIHDVSRAGGRARALQQNLRSAAPHPIYRSA
ncbi:hypothetical protein XvhCFBP2543_03100 [Xanthomonas vasicola]|uniref:Uncharacterized protein n=1 Tax=Xanthomonas vasicola TaxID=56459 RepID=A0ABD7SEN8_XANVA|nr:hypothetical protein NX81_008470 [Xanthomonas vasicola]RNK77128.1 hypothetical protein C9390_11630 [Xanthomonas vasicola pv. vasculorum]PPV03879.1 hypothetical protein XvhCFBP2543_03100 [Xanthomonas vasicola]RNL07501.1 hypothetical protein C9407_06385 [Xanthomonas vasicola pv. vasculorum]TWQ27602.1 hypothetical protein FQJ97_07895 [Xanthomonas vasicola]